MKRRDFVFKSALSAVALTKLRLPALPQISARPGAEGTQPSGESADSFIESWTKEDPSNQGMNTDFITFLPGVEYFLLGNGDIQAFIQYCKDHELAGKSSLFGLTLMNPERFTQKYTTFLFSPSHGLANTRMWVGVDGSFQGVDDGSFVGIGWEHVDGVPLVRMKWNAGPCHVEEEFFVPSVGATLFRRASVKNVDTSAHDVTTGLALYPNAALFDDIYTDPKRGTANADGFARLQLLSLEKNTKTIGRYDVRVEGGSVAPGDETVATYAYRINDLDKPLRKKDFVPLWSATSAYWKEKNDLSTGNQKIDHLWKIARTGIRAHVARDGKRDGGIWEYAMEWAGDDIMALMAALMTGFYDEAKILLIRTLDKLVTNDGRTVESSQVFPFQFTEIQQNGMILYGVWSYLAWTGDYNPIRERWEKMKQVADLPLNPYFWDKTSGLLANEREFWERSASFGVKPGFELAYQFWVSLGLEKISEVASRLGHKAEASRWGSAGRSIRRSFLHNEKFRLVEDGHLIKRRTLDGKWQRTFIPPDRAAMPEGTPIAVEKEPLVEPDASEVFPIIFGMIDAESSLSLKTLEWIEGLWNQRWKIGGYERYNSSSEPEPPGPWPIASLLIAEAYWEAGNFEKSLRVVNWLNEINGHMSGGWFEYYPEGHPSIGIIEWAWMECVRLAVDHILGVRPQLDKLVIRPRLSPDMDNVRAHIRVREMHLDLSINGSSSENSARADSRKLEFRNGELNMPYAGGGKMNVEINIARQKSI